MCPRNKVYTLTLQSPTGEHRKEFSLNPCSHELPQNVRMLCTPTVFSGFTDQEPSILGHPLAVTSDLFQPLSFSTGSPGVGNQANTLAYISPVMFTSKNASNADVKRTQYSIAETGPKQSCVVTSPFGKSITIELKDADGTEVIDNTGAKQEFDSWILVLEFRPIIEDEPRMEMMRY